MEWFEHYWGDHLVAGLILAAVVVGYLQKDVLSGHLDLTTADRLRIYYSNSALLWLLTLLSCAIWWWGDRTWSDLGLQLPSTGGAIAGAGLAILVFLAVALDNWNKVRTPQRRIHSLEQLRLKTPFLPSSGRELFHWMWVSASAGVCEEILFRSYLIQYLAAFLRPAEIGLWPAVAATGLVFGLMHSYQGPDAVLKIMLLAIAFGAYFVLTHSIVWLMLIHGLLDFVQGIVGMRWMARQAANP